MGLVLYWKLDEASGSMALDSSGKGVNGTYGGVVAGIDASVLGAPSPSPMVPAKVKFADPFSRSFVGANQQAVLTAMTSELKPANNFTLAAWYRATTTDTMGGDIINAGDSYILRLRPTQVEFTMRQPVPDAGVSFVHCFVTAASFRDGNWHHLAALATSSGMRLYYDGIPMCTNMLGADAAYDKGTTLVVGHHALGRTDYDFDGNIDDVRIYARVLSDSEIALLAQGNE